MYKIGCREGPTLDTADSLTTIEVKSPILPFAHRSHHCLERFNLAITAPLLEYNAKDLLKAIIINKNTTYGNAMIGSAGIRINDLRYTDWRHAFLLTYRLYIALELGEPT